ncbi:Protogenin A [Pseudolycoriella hygida]|uniref:Protogenin A n=1 Tax=Pseudolycoriella hygida TaxID=35572 RepID=A0A9Q0MT94_9DIPT|nr:Protogenin A [Pseudolycoriella hygida]
MSYNIISAISSDPQLKIVIHPPANVIISQLQPVFLPCSANYTGPYDYDHFDDGEIMDDLEEGEKVYKMKQTHFTDLKPDDFNEMPIYQNVDEEDESDSSTDFFKRDTYERKNIFVYKWLKNGLPLTHRSDFDIFPNGTLKLTKPKSASGIYQCVADGSKLGIGAVISTSCNVQRAVFTRYPAEKNVTAEASGFVLIDCPFYSIPIANITWKYANNTAVNFNRNNRRLLNNSLLITRLELSDSQSYKCTAQNLFDDTKPLRTFSTSLEVINSSENKLKFELIPLQSRPIEVQSGKILKLICVAYSGDVRWTFLHRNGNQSFNVNSTSSVLIYPNATFAAHDGFYNCSTTTDFQIFNVSVIVPPIIVQPLTSNSPAIGEFLSLNCTATGNPKPKIVWYKNGVPLIFDNIVTYNEPIVKINTYEEEHKGIYQCVANNSAGEVHSTAAYSWVNKRIPKRPEKVKCYPLNQSAILIEYYSYNEYNDILYYTSRNSSSSMKWISSAEYNIKKLDGKWIVPIPAIDLFDPFVFYLRGLVRIGHEQRVGGNQKLLYDMTRLSKGIKCALQGLEIYSIVQTSGIFIWWPKLHIPNLNHLNIQFRYNDSSNPTKFSDEIIGTKEKLNELERWADIQPKLVKIPAITNVYPEFDGSRKKRLILNNVKQSGSSDTTVNCDTSNRCNKFEGITEVRVSGKVTGILIPNTQFIDVRVLVPVMDEDGELYQDNTYVEWKTISKPSNLSQFQITDVESRSITISSTNKILNCVKACMTAFDSCQVIRSANSKFRIKSLAPNTMHRIFLYDCIQNYSQMGEINARTKQDIPGPITNYNIYNQNGWKLEWKPPEQTNGLLNIRYYEIEWTINNELHSANVTVDTNYFELPIGQGDKFNITIRAVSDSHGIPIHINSENLQHDNSKLPNYHSQQNDPTLGILIGAMLSLLCVLITCWIIVRYRTCSKNDIGHTSRNTTSPIPTQSANYNVDMHEMQNLITKPETVPSNTIDRNSRNGNKSERTILNSSTPKKYPNDEDYTCVFKVKSNDFNKNLAGIATNRSNGATCVDDNIAVLSQNKHSNVENILPSTPPNDNIRTSPNPQYSSNSPINTSLFDRSQQQLLCTTIDSNINISTLNNENDDTLELNGDSSYSQQPLHNWSFRRPIIGPNG